MSTPLAAKRRKKSGAPAIETHALRKTYRRGRQVAVDDLDLTVPRGGVHGFLGPNGSGKTTTIRMLLGLIRADGGSMTVLGREVPDRLPEVIGEIGAIVEQPKFFPAFTGRKNLSLLADAIGTDRSRVEGVLAEVGLAERGRDRFRGYSLGMRQRLAIAATLLKDPELLIFDEPTNGLDPAGIHEIRDTIKGLGASGRTVLVSSHILSEVQLVADTVTIIGRGRLLASGDVSELLAHATGGGVRLRVADPDRATAVLTGAGHQVQPQPDGALLLRPAADASVPAGTPFDPSTVTALLAAQQLFVSELVTVRPDLEQVFLALTAEEHLGAAQGAAGRGAAAPGAAAPGAGGPGAAAPPPPAPPTGGVR